MTAGYEQCGLFQAQWSPPTTAGSAAAEIIRSSHAGAAAALRTGLSVQPLTATMQKVRTVLLSILQRPKVSSGPAVREIWK